MQRPLAQPHRTHSLTRPAQGHRGGAGLGGMGAAGSPFEKGPPQKQASHMCKMHLVKINTGFVFSIKIKSKQKTSNGVWK